MTQNVIEELRGLAAAAKFGPLTCDNYFPSEIFEATPNGPAMAIEIRGWGWLQKQVDGEQVQDARGRLVHAAMSHLPALLAAIEAATRLHDQCRHRGDGTVTAPVDAKMELGQALSRLTATDEGK